MSKKLTSLESMSALFSPDQLKALEAIITAKEVKTAVSKVKVTKIPTGISGKSDVPCTVSVGDYKGKATITLTRGEISFINKPFTFGKGKAQMIVEQYEAIKKFAESK